jgi:hypothetical protein
VSRQPHDGHHHEKGLAMHNRMPSRRRASTGNPPDRGETVPAQGQTQEQHRVPRAPHERDESANSQARDEASAGRVAEIAREDVESGRVDTDKGPAMDETYERQQGGAADPLKKLSP